MARKRKRNNNDSQSQNQKKSGGQVKKQGYGSDLKPTRCSKCRFDRKDEPCYKKRALLSGLEYVDCVPGMIHYQYKKLETSGLI